MKNILLILLLTIIYSCSSNWYLKKAIQKNPHLLDSIKVTTIVVHTDTIRDTIKVEGHNFGITLDSLKRTNDSLTLVYSDSILNIYAYVDNLKKIHIRGNTKTIYVPYEKIVHDTFTVTVPCPKPYTIVNITDWQKFQMYSGRILWIILAIGLMFGIYKLLK